MAQHPPKVREVLDNLTDDELITAFKQANTYLNNYKLFKEALLRELAIQAGYQDDYLGLEMISTAVYQRLASKFVDMYDPNAPPS